MKLSKDNYVEFNISENAKDGYDELIKELALLNDFEYFRQNFEKFGKYITKLKQENQALKYRWEKLKKWVDESGCFLDDGSFSGDVVISIYAILDKMQELEDRQ